MSLPTPKILHTYLYRGAFAPLWRGWVILAVFLAVIIAVDIRMLGDGERPLIDRHTCLEEPSSHTRSFDTSVEGDAAYRFIYLTLFGLGNTARQGFPHLVVRPACTVGWRHGTAAIKIGAAVYLFQFRGPHVLSLDGPGADLHV